MCPLTAVMLLLNDDSQIKFTFSGPTTSQLLKQYLLLL